MNEIQQDLMRDHKEINDEEVGKLPVQVNQAEAPIIIKTEEPIIVKTETLANAKADAPIEEKDKPFPMKRPIAVSMHESETGTEVILYETPQEIPETSNFHIVMYIFIQLGSEILLKIAIGALILYAHNTPSPGFGPAVLALAIFAIWKISFNLFYFVQYGNRVPEYKKVYVFDTILAIGYLCMFWGGYSYLKGNIPASSLPLFIVPHIILSFIRLCAGEMMNTPYLPLSFFTFLESLQILYIALKLSNPEAHASWTWVLLFYYMVTILFMIFAFIIMIVLIIFLSMILFRSEMLRDWPNLGIFLICSLLFYFAWNGIMYYYLLSGFHYLLEANQIGPKGISGTMNPRLIWVSWILIICGTITFILICFIYCYLKEALISLINKDKAKEISLQSFAKNLNLNVKAVSGNYFKKKGEAVHPSSRSIGPEEKQNLDICLICCSKESDIMIHPCGHSGACQECISDFLKEKETCPLCREKIEKIYLVTYDETKKTYLAKGVIKVKR